MRERRNERQDLIKNKSENETNSKTRKRSTKTDETANRLVIKNFCCFRTIAQF